LRNDRLVARIEIDNFQASSGERTEIRLIHTLLVRPSVHEGSCRTANPVRTRVPILMGKAGDSAQLSHPFCSVKPT
jgi:hypothetical protein